MHTVPRLAVGLTQHFSNHADCTGYACNVTLENINPHAQHELECLVASTVQFLLKQRVSSCDSVYSQITEKKVVRQPKNKDSHEIGDQVSVYMCYLLWFSRAD